MRSPIFKFFWVALLVAIPGCGSSGPTVDASSKESAKASLEEMGKDLSEAERKEFMRAVGAIMLDDFTKRNGRMPNVPAEAPDPKVLHGKTKQQLLDEGNAIIRAREESRAKKRK